MKLKTEFYILQGTGKDFQIITQSSKQDLRDKVDTILQTTSKDTIYYIGLDGNIDKKEAIREVKKR